MSYNFYSLVSSIKDKSSQAMATLSSDLKEFGSIVQEDVAEISKTVRKTVHEQSEALRQRVEEKQTEEEEGRGDDRGEEKEETKEEEDDDAATEERTQVSTVAKEEEKPTTSLFASFTGLSLEAMGSKILQSADELLGSLAGPDQEEEEEEEEDEEERVKLESARRYRLLALQEDAHTYVHPPMDVETFLKWRKALGDDELQAIQAEVLAHYPTVVEKLAELVPETVSSEDFWAHYIYKASLLAAQEQRGADLLEHALNDSEEEVGWDVESPRQGSENGGSGQSFEEDPVTGDALPMLRTADASEPSSPAPVLGEQRPASPSGSDADDARTSPLDSVSSDGESWIELDEQRRELAQQPPLSTSSSTSSFVPVDGVYAAGPPAPIAVAVKDVAEDQVLNDEEDVDWGDDVDQDSEEAVATAVSVGPETQPPKKAGGADWGEWD